MPLEITETAGGRVLEVRVTGRLTRKEYERYLPTLEQQIKERGKLRLLVIKHELQGLEAGALWEDLKFDLRHLNDIERLAIVGRARWRRNVSALYHRFLTSNIRYFNEYEIDKAREWVQE